MKNLFKSLLFIALAGLSFTACDNPPCEDITCDPGQVLTIDCDCLTPGGTQTGPMDGIVVDVVDNITTDVTWTADNEYVLRGRITVSNGATLTIEPGTVIKGAAGSDTNAKALLIARGSQIDACGTAQAPIVMTTVADEITPEDIAAGNFSSPNMDPSIRGLWGGLIVLGNAPISLENEDAQVQIEGIPTNDANGLYGGSDPADNSGRLCYISIRHGGTNIGSGNEINGLTLGGVGSGTTINNIEVVANADDGIEWFGGTVNCESLLIWQCGDDGLDTDQSYSGTVNGWIVALPAGGSAMELDGPEGSLNTGCNNFIRGSIFCGDNIDHIIDWDPNTNTGIQDLYITGIDAGYDLTEAIESFGGDAACNTGNWQINGGGLDVSQITILAPGEITESTANGIGMGIEMFGWTWGGHSGALSDLSL